MLLKLSKFKPILIHSGSRITNEDESKNVNLNFIYLTQIDIPHITLFLYKGQNYIFHDNITPSNLQKIRQIMKINLIRQPEKTLRRILKNHENLKIYTLGNNSEFKIPKFVKLDSNWLDEYCRENRPIKQTLEIKNISESAKQVSLTIIDGWKKLPKGKYQTVEKWVQELKEKCPLQKIAYRTICSTGQNITDLHYHPYDSIINSRSMILLDMGYKYDNYCCDITRTFPKSGKFTLKQKKIYQIVLDIQEDILSKIKPKVNFKNLESDCYLQIYHRLAEINILNKPELPEIEKIDFVQNNIMYHGLGHHVGLEVHDVGNYDMLEKNMVLAVEPGIYFPEKLLSHKLVNSKELQKYLDIGGVRIEDTVLVTSQGNRILNKINLKTNLPKKISEIEQFMKK